jgi:hypothetical protein
MPSKQIPKIPPCYFTQPKKKDLLTFIFVNLEFVLANFNRRFWIEKIQNLLMKNDTN